MELSGFKMMAIWADPMIGPPASLTIQVGPTIGAATRGVDTLGGVQGDGVVVCVLDLGRHGAGARGLDARGLPCTPESSAQRAR